MNKNKHNKNKVTIVIPTYNEEKRINNSLRSIHRYMEELDVNYEVLISDDGSTDNTRDIIEEFQKKWKELKLIKNKHRGKAPTLLRGLKAADGNQILFTDTDLSVPITELPKMLQWLDSEHGYDISIASREAHGARRINEPFLRHLMGRVFNYLVQVVILPGINDTQCGFKAFKRDVIHRIIDNILLYNVNSVEITGGKVSGVDVEMLFIARRFGYRIKEVPVEWTYKDNSKVHSLKDSYYNALDVFKIRINSILGRY